MTEPSQTEKTTKGEGQENSGPDLHDPKILALLERYWRANVRITLVLLAVWAAVGLGCGILFADWLNQFKLPGTGFPLGFWFAHQGAIITFVLLILVYCLLLNRMDARHHRDIQQIRNGEGGGENGPS
jgi:putative solute:sodium symporter small subunit